MRVRDAAALRASQAQEQARLASLIEPLETEIEENAAEYYSITARIRAIQEEALRQLRIRYNLVYGI